MQFQPIRLKWDGTEYVVAPNRVLMAIAAIEEVLTLDEMLKYSMRGTTPIARIAMAFGALLRYAGAPVSDDDVFAGIFADGNGVTATVTIDTLLRMMIPPEILLKGMQAPKDGDQGKAESNSASNSSANATSSVAVKKRGSRRKRSGA